MNHTTGVKVGSHGLQRSASREMMNNEGRESVSPDGRPLTATDRGASNSNRRLDFAFFEMGEVRASNY